MATKSIVVHIDDEEVTLVLGPARKADGIRRAEMMVEALSLPDTNLTKPVAFFQYPTCVNAVKTPEYVKHMSLKDFIDKVDEADIEAWTEDAFEINPQWKRAMQNLANMPDQMSVDDEKKTGVSSTGSPQPTEPPTQT